MNKTSLTFVLAAILALVHEGTCWSCYLCTDAVGVVRRPSCVDPFDFDAGIAITHCVYGCEKTTIEYPDHTDTFRGCYPLDIAPCTNDCRHDGTGTTTCSYCCSGDLCNGVGTISFSFLAMTCGSLLAVFVSHFW